MCLNLCSVFVFIMCVSVCVSPMASIYRSREMNGALWSSGDYTAHLLSASPLCFTEKQDAEEQRERSAQRGDKDVKRREDDEVRTREGMKE